uniref:Uncharacterized protein n=1 Tax=Sphenodon punctatus TaxID=8508 RepID=A0A8D0G5S4_SPHPU
MIMKIQKKEKQLPSLKVLSHSPMSDASITCECKSQAPFADSTDQENLHHQVKIADLASQFLAQKDQYPDEEPEAVQKTVTSQNGMQDSGGGGTGVKK